MDFEHIKNLDDAYGAEVFSRFPVAFVGGRGATLTDTEGKEYIDFGSGIAVNVFGACDEAWKNAVKEQLDKIQHVSNYYYCEPQAKLSELLCARTGARRVFFANSGAEANECALKAARKYSFEKYGAGRAKIVSLNGSFHGRTLFTVTAKTLDKNFIKSLETFCKERDVLLICDEVQSGNGRTGTLYSYEQFGISPDIVTTAKGLGGGLPIGACLFFRKTEHTLKAGDHGSTFGGNPVCCAGAVNVIERLDENFLLEVRAKGDYMRTKLRAIDGVKAVTGLGLMIGLEVNGNSKDIAKKCLEKGLLVLTAHERVRIVPPLNITKREMDEGLTIFREVLRHETST